MTLKVFNTMSRKKEAIRHKNLNLYTCGPTVYDYAHIGNMRAYLFYDLLKRYLTFKGVKVKHVMNLTDVEDKIIRDSRKKGMPWKEFTEQYAKAFFEDLATLRITPADVYPRATEHISDMVDVITKLMLRGYAYRGEDGSVYFSIKKFRHYGKLSRTKIKKLKTGARVKQDEYTKENAADFALWKKYDEEDGDVFWITPLGKGRPGWHIECSVMSAKYLKTVDMHGGGIDLVFPHHENEIAQYEAASGKKFVKYWVHCNHLYAEGRKMSKSLGNFFTLRDIVQKGVDPVAFRYLCFSTHYRSQLNFTLQSVEDAKQTVDSINDFVSRIAWLKDEVKAKPNHSLHVLIKRTRERFARAMDDDLNTPAALAAVFDLIKGTNKAIDRNRADKKSLAAIYQFTTGIDRIFDVLKKHDMEITEEEEGLIEKREELRKQKRFEEADVIRAALKEKGVILEDTPHGVRWKRIKR